MGGLVRALPVAAHPLPLDDGGLFYQMATDIVAARFTLPIETTYNGGIPFAYPPLGLYLAALAAQIPGVEMLDVIRWLPAVIAILAIPAFYLLAREMAPSRYHALAATAAFALIPRAYQWLIIGGGLTRALGLLLALLAIQQSLRLYRTGRWRHVITTGVLGGLVLLTHPQGAVFAGMSVGIVLIASGPRLRAIAQTAVAGVIAFGVVAPWLAVVIVRHGSSAVTSAGATGTDLAAGASALFSLFVTDIGTLDLFTAMGVVGAFVLLARGQWLAPAWLAAVILVDPRAGHTYAAVPLAVLTMPVIAGIVSLLARTLSPAELESVPVPRLVRRVPQAALFVGLLLFAGLRTNSLATVDRVSPLQGVTEEQHSSMSWIARNTPEDAEVAVVTGREWTYDYVSEWLPVFTGRQSVATVQGSEWTGRFIERLATYRQLQACATRTATCVDSWMQGYGYADLYLYVPDGDLRGGEPVLDCCPALRETLRVSGNFEVLEDGPGGTVFRSVNE